jgi:chromosomal replication initiator protein
MWPDMQVRYVSTEEFTNDFINSIRDNAAAFQRRYRSVDLLLIDDIQFIVRAERTQEEFFHTFNALHHANKQIVITSDAPPRQLSGLVDRLRLRFEWGLQADVQAPDLETRTAILRKKAAADHLAVDDDVLDLIASRVTTNVRELEGALIRGSAWASLNGVPLTPDLVRNVLRDIVPGSDTPAITIASIKAAVCEYYSVEEADLTGSSRTRSLVQVRQVGMFLCRELTDASLPKIGEAFHRDHTTVLYAVQKVRDGMSTKPQLYQAIDDLTRTVRGNQAR